MREPMRGPSVLALVGDITGPTLWRVFFPITALEREKYPAGWDYTKNKLIADIAPAFDGYLLPRIAWQPQERRTAQAWFDSIRAAGKFAVYECDDDIFTSAETSRRQDLGWTDGKTYEQLEAERYERIWAMQQCDGVTVSTQRLATIVRSFTDRPVIVVPNAIDLQWFRSVLASTKRKIPGLTIGWAGGRRHDRDVEAMAIAWGRLARRYPHVTFVVMGFQPDVIGDNVPADRLVRLPWLRPELYPAGIKQIDIGCCSVADTPFNRAKSAIKCFEYAAAGAAVVASPTLYASVVEDGHSGMIAEDSADQWEAALSALIERPALRAMMARRLLRIVEKKHSLAANLWRWPAAWAAIQESARERRGSLVLA